MEQRTDHIADDAAHIDADALALVALGESADDTAVRQHLEHCALCRDEVAALRSTITVARSTMGEVALIEPPARVWQAVRGELGLDPTLQPPSRPARVHSPISVASAPAPLIELLSRRERRSGIRRTVAVVAASAAAAAVITGAVLGWGAAAPRDAGQVLASTVLDALPDWQEATGDATLAQLADGERVLRVSLDASVDADIVREVWLLTPEVDGLISLGYLTAETGEFIVPDSVDIDRYSVVDISAEPLDGDPTHSGDSIVRGALDS
jgi:hypothetical protein